MALNLFLLAFVGAQTWWLHHPWTTPGTFAANDLGSRMLAAGYLRQITSTLPEADGRLLREAYAAKALTLIALSRQLRASAEQIGADIGARSLGLDQVKTDMAAAQAARQEIGQSIQAILLNVLPGRPIKASRSRRLSA
ncbi:periplasmic heavy metal sensor [Acidisphaera sp. L21]|uniref:periplasmic heavy metal sensor n=1 Tax=Acidisphaera sp. L21 TaxID=1641851 RepID=UPI00210FECB1|nr:periplasmic heavy metal sensor [Acidisphaera sp. L21]